MKSFTDELKVVLAATSPIIIGFAKDCPMGTKAILEADGKIRRPQILMTGSSIGLRSNRQLPMGGDKRSSSVMTRTRQNALVLAADSALVLIARMDLPGPWRRFIIKAGEHCDYGS